MDDLSDLHDALPSCKTQRGSQHIRGPTSYKGNNRVQSGGYNNNRGSRGFSNQRGPGRGRSRVQSGHRSAPQQSAWGQKGSSQFTFTERSEPVIHTVNSQSAEEKLKQIVNRDPNSPNEGARKTDDHNSKNEKTSAPITGRNTVEFEPSHVPAEMRILPARPGVERYTNKITARDVIIVSDLFNRPGDESIYKNLLEEVETNRNHEWKLWHCDTHVIADDKTRRNQVYPVFDMVIDRIREYFKMHVHATRFNWFRDTKDWKPYHHDAAALKPEKAAVQNFTAAVSFGTEREVAFKHATTGSTISIPLPNGTLYTFCNDVNVIWRHGIPQVPPDKQVDEGRISIVAWGWVDDVESIS